MLYQLETCCCKCGVRVIMHSDTPFVLNDYYNIDYVCYDCRKPAIDLPNSDKHQTVSE